MNNFVFHNATKIIFGKETEARVGVETSQWGRKVLLHYGGNSIKKNGLYDRVIQALKGQQIDWVELGGVQPNPRLSLVKTGIDMCRKEGVDFILAVGGGSVIDSAKAIAMGIPYTGDVWDFFEGKAELKTALPLGVVLTIPAAGSESSTGTVITKEEGWLKRSANSIILRPKFAIMNPEITFTLPAYQTASGVADMMAHIFERYFSQTENVDLTDRLSEATLKTIIKNVRIVMKEPEDYAARAEIMWAGTIAHNDLLSTGRNSDWATHGMEHELSALYDLTHGAGLAILFPAWMQYVYRENPAKFMQFFERVWDVEPDYAHPEKMIAQGIDRLKYFYQSIGLPVTFQDAGLPVKDLEEMAEKCTKRGPIGNFKKLYKEDVLAIYRMASLTT
ncbi:MAG: iron-containing alcohol dehydrogenase [Thermotogae bacterium]|nr:iron-containing alcohol dehydrogenase [Thermotogota bacterium]